jgi:hypothetical protein
MALSQLLNKSLPEVDEKNDYTLPPRPPATGFGHNFNEIGGYSSSFKRSQRVSDLASLGSPKSRRRKYSETDLGCNIYDDDDDVVDTSTPPNDKKSKNDFDQFLSLSELDSCLKQFVKT